MNLTKAASLLTLLLTLSCSAYSQLPVLAESFPISDVRLTAGPFRHAEDMDIRYMLALDPDRLLAPYLREAGLEPKAKNYPNWEDTGLDGHIGGHYLSALSLMYAATGNEEIKRRLDYMVSELRRAQEAVGDGYLCGAPDGRRIWKEVSQGDIRAESFGLNGGWVPLYNIHKVYAGLRDAYLYAGVEDAREMLVKLADWMAGVVSALSEEQMQDMLRSEHGGLNETFADVAAITGDKQYLELARKFSHKQILQPLLRHEDQLTGIHANTQIPKVIGYKRIADLEGNAEWSEAARYFWETVVTRRSVSIGGNSVREHFHPSDDFSSMMTSEQGPETCNTYNMLRLTKLLYQTSADPKYMDYYERALLNHILSTQDPVQGGFVYFTPMRSGHYRVYSQPQTSFWCCVGSGMENHARYGEMIYSHSLDEKLFVNLFIASTLKWGDMEIEQMTSFPDEEATTIAVRGGTGRFSLCLRIPEWADRNEMTLTVNDKPEEINAEGGYVTLSREWRRGDRVRLTMPMHLRALDLPDGSGRWSVLYGPVVLAAQISKQDQDGMFADESRGGHIANGPRLALQNMPVIVGDSGDVLSHLEKLDGLRFRLTGMYPEQYEGLELEPFYRLRECRYAVYFPVYSSDALDAYKAELEAAERQRMALDAATVDKVTCGEQQPESDHFYMTGGSSSGSDEGVHWRETRAWFSYQMRTGGRRPSKVRLSLRADSRRDGRVSVGGVDAGVITAGSGVQEFAVPDAVRNLEVLEVKVSSCETEVTPHIYEVRLME